MSDILRTSALLLLLLNPFLIVIYITDIVQNLERHTFLQVLVRAGIIAVLVFSVFALLGDTIFSNVLQADFASFQIFGGIVFLLIAIKFVFHGPGTLAMLRSDSGHLAGAVAMPVLIGPGTISASVVAGKRHEPHVACLLILVVVVFSLALIFAFKVIHDLSRPRSEGLIQRYIEVTGRIAALVVGTFSIEMIMNGLHIWMEK